MGFTDNDKNIDKLAEDIIFQIDKESKNLWSDDSRNVCFNYERERDKDKEPVYTRIFTRADFIEVSCQP